MIYLTPVGENSILSEGVLCVSLTHNEFDILPEFLHHYRSLGITSFAMVDDRSTDDTRQFLLSQDDVTVFTPNEGSAYNTHKALWRKDILDTYGIGRWCINADIDEHFVYLDMETKSLANLIDELDREDSKALLTIMVDMYQDRSILEQNYQPNHETLLQAFPYFDRLHPWIKNYYFAQGAFDFPTPPITVHGGFRSRLLNVHDGWWRSVRKNLIRQCYWECGASVNLHSRRRKKYKYPSLHKLLRLKEEISLSLPWMSKLGLIKWQHGMILSGGAHGVNLPVRCSERIGAFLHYYFAHGIDHFHYIVKRGKHWNNSYHYIRFLRAMEEYKQSPVHSLSMRYVDSRSLKNLIR